MYYYIFLNKQLLMLFVSCNTIDFFILSNIVGNVTLLTNINHKPIS